MKQSRTNTNPEDAADSKMSMAPSKRAASLWQRARLSAARRRETPARSGSLEVLSDEVGTWLHGFEKTQQVDAAESFIDVHSRLMEAISASREVTTPAITSEFVEEWPSQRHAERYAVRPRKIWEFWQRDDSAPPVVSPLAQRVQSHLLPAQKILISWGVVALFASATGFGGHYLGRQKVARLPTDSLISDFEGSIRSGVPLPLFNSDTPTAASWLGRTTGLLVHLPATHKTGVRLIGARSHNVEGKSVAQAHYERRGVRLALYQMRAPEIGLSELEEQTVRGRAFFTRSSGFYRLVAWRSGENILAMVSPLEMSEAVKLAADIRDNPDGATT